MIGQFDFTAAIAEAKAEIEAALTELPRLREAHIAAEAAASNARDRFGAFVARFNAAIRNSKAASALERMLETEQRARDAANSAAMRAKHVVDNHQWHIASARDGLRQIELAANPPPPERLSAVVLRSKPDADDSYDVITFPAGRAA
jgi:hypothetical protein